MLDRHSRIDVRHQNAQAPDAATCRFQLFHCGLAYPEGTESPFICRVVSIRIRQNGEGFRCSPEYTPHGRKLQQSGWLDIGLLRLSPCHHVRIFLTPRSCQESRIMEHTVSGLL